MGRRAAGVRRRERDKGPVFQVRFRDLDGRQRSRTFDREADARRFNAEVTSRLMAGSYVSPSSGQVSFGSVAERWYETTAGLKARSRLNYRTILDVWLVRWWDVPVGKLRAGDCQDLINEMVRVGRQPPTVRNVALVLRGILEQACLYKEIEVNPATRLVLPRLRKTEQLFLTPAQVNALAAQLEWRDALYVRMAAGTGLRAGELVGLRVRDLDLLRRRVQVSRSVADVRGKLIFQTPKSDASIRRVPLSGALARELEDLGRGPDDLIFGGDGIRPLRHNSWFQKVFRPAVVAAELPPGVRFHDLRHTYASLNIAAGVHPKRLSAWLGHTSVALTMDRYGHLYDDDQGAPTALEALHGDVGVRAIPLKVSEG